MKPKLVPDSLDHGAACDELPVTATVHPVHLAKTKARSFADVLRIFAELRGGRAQGAQPTRGTNVRIAAPSVLSASTGR